MPSFLQNVVMSIPLNGEPLSESMALGITCHCRMAAMSARITVR